MIDLFFVESADYLQFDDLDKFISNSQLNMRNLQVGDFLKMALAESHMDSKIIDNKIILDQTGKLITFETCMDELVER